MGFLIALLKSDKNCSVPRQVPMCFLCLIQDCLIKVTLKLSFCHGLSPGTALLFPYALRQADTLSNTHVGFSAPSPPTPCGCTVVGDGRHRALGRTGSSPKLGQARSLDSSHFSMLEKGSWQFCWHCWPRWLCPEHHWRGGVGVGAAGTAGSKGFIKACSPRQMSGLPLHLLSILPICSLWF